MTILRSDHSDVVKGIISLSDTEVLVKPVIGKVVIGMIMIMSWVI
jgi:hypothetical protein